MKYLVIITFLFSSLSLKAGNIKEAEKELNEFINAAFEENSIDFNKVESLFFSKYSKVNSFNDFFVYHGKLGIFFAVQVGAVGSMLFLYWMYNRYKKKIEFAGETKIRSYVPAFFIVLMIVALTLSTFVDPNFTWFGGTSCMVIAFLCMGFSRFATPKERMWVVTRYDWGTTAFLAYGLANIVDSVWKAQPWGTTVRHMVDGLVYSLLTAGAFGWLWP